MAISYIEQTLISVFCVLQYADMMRKTNAKELCQWKIWEIRQLQLANCIYLTVNGFIRFFNYS